MLDDIKMYKKIIIRGFLQLKRPEYLIYAPFETIYHTVYWRLLIGYAYRNNFREYLDVKSLHYKRILI